MGNETSGRHIELNNIEYTTLYIEMVKAKKKPTRVAKEIGIADHTMLRKMRGRTAWTLWEAIAIKNSIGYPGPLEELFERG